MDQKQYEQAALRTMADQAKIRQRIQDGVDKNNNLVFSGKGKYESSVNMTQLDNAARGMAGDVGEVNTCIQATLEYGKPLDRENLLEELGDVMWRIVQICNVMEWKLEQVFEANIRKLAVRYPEQYSDVLADEDNRDREAERAAVTKQQQIEQTWQEIPKIVAVTKTTVVRLCRDCGKEISEFCRDSVCDCCRSVISK